jgi:hypothetical protein
MNIISATIRRSTSTHNNENIRNEYESIDENDHDIGLTRDDQQMIPKRRQSRVTSSNNKVNGELTSNIPKNFFVYRMIQHQI